MSVEVEEAARAIEALTGIPYRGPAVGRAVTRKERRAQRERVREFLGLPVPLQEACLRYARQVRKAYTSGG